MSVFDRIGGGAARLLLRAGFLRHAVRPPSPDQLAATESDLGRRLLAGLLRNHPLSRDPAAWDLLRRVRDLLRPALAARGLVFQPVALDHDIHVEVLASQQHVSHEAAHHVRAQPRLVGMPPDRADGVLHVVGRAFERPQPRAGGAVLPGSGH